MQLMRLNVSEALALPLPGAGDALGQRNIEILGSASFSGLANLVRALSANGYPVRVLSLSLTREALSAERFEVQAVLAIFHSVEQPPIEPEASSEDTQEN